MTDKLSHRPTKAIKHLLKIGLVGAFIIPGLFGVFSNVFSATIFEDNFETYNLDDIIGQNGWYSIQNPYPDDKVAIIVDTEKKEGFQALNLTLRDYTYSVSKFGIPTTAGSIGFWFKTKDLLENNNNFYFVLRSEPSDLNIVYLRIGDEIKYQDNAGLHTIGTIENDVWYSADIEWSSAIRQIRVKFNGGEWSEWSLNLDNTTENVGGVLIQFNPLQEFNYFFVDYIAETSEIPVCSLENCFECDDFFECQVVGCCWYYQPGWPEPFDNFCDICEGVCSYPENCGLCITETTCEAQGCFWAGDYCTQFEWECGPELACQFCLNQITCETEGCSWSTTRQTCWYAVPTLPTSWSSYYDEYGEYEIPAELVNNLAETTGKTFAVISGFFEGFITSFNTAEAFEKGQNLGQVIPTARGYLGIFDNFLGGFPIGELFIFLLVFMIAVGVFRIVRNLFQLIKFW